MPNHVENWLTVEGKAKEVEAFCKKVEGVTAFDFNKIIPYPKKFKRLDDIATSWEKEHPDIKYCKDRPTDGFNSGGYEWRLENWGTKWSGHQVRGPVFKIWPNIDYVLADYLFETAWDAPTPILEVLAKKFPELVLKCTSLESGTGTMWDFRSGSEISKFKGEYYGYRGG